MRYCQRCGVPRILTSEHSWSPNGTIYVSGKIRHRMVFIDSDALNHILDSISARIGIPLDPIVQEAKRKSGKDFMDAVLSGAKGMVARNLISTRVYEQLSKQVSLLGLGNAEVKSYRRHSYLEGIITDAYNAPAITGDICGAFESVEGCTAEAHYEATDGTVHCYIVKSKVERPEFAGRFAYVEPPSVDGRNIYELCPVCKAPLALGAQYSFDMDKGVIVDTKTGHRVVLIGVMALVNLFGELTNELGEEIPSMIMEIEKDRIKEIIASKGSARDVGRSGYLRYMKTLNLKGMGSGRSVSIEGDSVEIRVDNPYYEPLIAGFLAGFYEATSEGDARVAWTEGSEGYTDITIHPAS